LRAEKNDFKIIIKEMNIHLYLQYQCVAGTPKKKKAIPEKSDGDDRERRLRRPEHAEARQSSGVSPATIYIYFKDREDLILQVFEEVNGEMLRPR